MKKIISWLLVIALVFQFVPSMAFAAEEIGFSTNIQLDAVKPGDTITVEVILDNDATVAGLQLELGFDVSKLKYNKYTLGQSAPAATGVTEPEDAKGSATILFEDSQMKGVEMKAGVLCIFEFTVLENTELGKYQPNLTVVDVTDQDAETLPYKVNTVDEFSIYSEITGDQSIAITAPVKGATPQTDITEGSGYTGVVTWAPVVSSNSSDVKFAANTAYTATVTLTAKDYYKFAADATASVAGATIQNLQVAADGTALTFEAVFPTTADKVLTELEITKAPTKTAYVEGQSFDATGMVVTATYDDGTVDADFKGYTVVNGSNLAEDTSAVTIKAGDVSVTQDITVEAKKLVSIAVGGDFKTAYIIGDAADWTGMVVTATYNDDTTAVLNAGDYTVNGFDSAAYADSQAITVAASGITATFNISIAKKVPTADDFTVPLSTDAVYDGTAKAVTVTAAEGITGMGAITVKYNGKAEAPSNAGSYAVTIDVAEGDTYQAATDLAVGQLVIAKATPTITVENSKTVVIGNTVALGAGINPDDLALAYSSADTGKVSVNAAGNVKGEAITDTPVTVTVSFAGNDNYEAATKAVAVTVTAKNPVVVSFADATAQTYQPDGYALGSQFNSAECVAGDVKYYYNGKEYENLNELGTVTVKDAGTYTVQAVFEDATQYGTAEASFTINKAEQAALIVNNATVQFGQSLSLSAAGGSGTGAITYGVTDGTGKATVEGTALTPTQAGTVTVVATKAEDNNYKAVTSAAQTITITKAEALLLPEKSISCKVGTTASAYVFVKDVMPADAGALTYTAGAAIDEAGILDAWTVGADGQVCYTLAAARAADDKVMLPVIIESANYENSVLRVVICITDKDAQQPLVLDSAAAVTYGEGLTLSTTGGSGSGAVSYTVTNGTGKAVLDGNVLTALQAGTVTVQATKAEDADYSAASSNVVTITIQKATPSGAPAYAAITAAGKTLADAHLTIGSITTSGAISWNLDDATEVQANTSYDWTFTPDDAVNYEGLTGSVVLWQKGAEPVDPTPSRPSGSSGSGGGFSGTYNYPVKADSTGDATVTFDKSYAVAGDKVTITVQPKAGKAVEEVLVTDKNGNVIAVTKAGDNQYSFTMPSGEVQVAVSTRAAVYDKRIVLQINNRNVRIDNTTFTNDVAPVIVDNRTMVPIRVVTEALGGKADWNAAAQLVTLTIDGNVLRMTIGQTIPGFDAAPVILNDRTYVPIRYVAEKLGANVEWIAATQQIIIEK